MKIIIAGAGRVGVALARYLRSEDHDIVLIDQKQEKILELSDQLDIQVVWGSACFPNILAKAGAEEADIFLAVTDSDETNIVSCSVAKSVFNISKRIARIGSPEYINPKYKAFLSALSIEVVLSPEMETAYQIVQSLGIADALDVATLANGLLKFIALKCKKNSTLNGLEITKIGKFTKGTGFQLLAVTRRDKSSLSDRFTTIREGDIVYFTIEEKYLIKILDTFGYTEIPLESIVILGGGKVGGKLAEILENKETKNVVLIEKNPLIATSLAEKLPKTLVVCADALDETLQEEVQLKNYNISVSTTDSDETNILLSLLAKRNGVFRTCTLLRSSIYPTLLTDIGVDLTIDPSTVMVSSILQHIRKGKVKEDYFIQSGLGEILEIEALRTSKIIQKPIGNIKIPKGILIVGVIRDNSFIQPHSTLLIHPKDLVLVFVQQGKANSLEKLFSVAFSFFK